MNLGDVAHLASLIIFWSRYGLRGHSRNLACVFFPVVASARKVGRAASGALSVVLCSCDTMSTPGHTTITRNGNCPSTRVPRVILITSFGSHVSSRVCASFAVLGIAGQSLLSTLLQLDVRMQGLLLGCAVISLLWCKSQFSSLSTILSSWYVVSESKKSMGRAARRIGRRRVEWPRRGPRLPRMRVRKCLFRWRMFLSWWICWLAKLSCGSLPRVGTRLLLVPRRLQSDSVHLVTFLVNSSSADFGSL